MYKKIEEITLDEYNNGDILKKINELVSISNILMEYLRTAAYMVKAHTSSIESEQAYNKMDEQRQKLLSMFTKETGEV